MMGVVSAELLKLRRRPATWIIGGLMLATLALFGYIFNYIFLNAELPGMPADMDLLSTLLPETFMFQTVSQMAGFGGVFGIVLGALATGSEYGWGTWKTLAIQGPSKALLSAGKMAAIAIVTLLLTIGYALTALLSSFAVAAAEGAAMTLPPPGELIGGLGAAWLILTVWTFFGAALATLTRSAAMGMGIGLGYAFVIENLAQFLPLPARVGEILAAILPGANSGALSLGFGDSPFAGMGLEPVDPWQAAVVLVVYVAVAVVLATLVPARREVI